MKNYDMFKSEGKTATLKKYLTKFVEVGWRLMEINLYYFYSIFSTWKMIYHLKVFNEKGIQECKIKTNLRPSIETFYYSIREIKVSKYSE